MNIEIIKSKKLTYLLLLLYLMYGVYKMMLNEYISHSYMILSFFMFFKIIFNYYQCTISYIECKIRKVKKEEGYLYSFLNNFIELRNEKIFISSTYFIRIIPIKYNFTICIFFNIFRY